MSVTELSSIFDVKELAEHLQNFRRNKVIVVVTPHATDGFLFDAEQIAAETSDKDVQVFRISEPDLTYTLTDELGNNNRPGSKLSVFGGAARIYPRGTTWLDHMWDAPLSLARNRSEAEQRQPALIDKAIELSYLSPREMQRPTRLKHPSQLSHSPAIPANLIPKLSTAKAAEEPAAERPVAPVTPLPQSASSEPVAKTVSERDRTIAERDQTITTLNDYLRDEQERVFTMTEMLISAQEQHQSAKLRWDSNEIKTRELLVENAALKKRISDMTTTHKTQLKNARTRTVTTETAASPYRPSQFPSTEDAMRFAILNAWVERVPATEKQQHPLPEYLVGAEFAASFEQFDRVVQGKTLKAVVDVLTGLDRKRQIHHMRQNASAQPMIREDGATCFRAYVEEKVSSARRLHFWKLEDGTIELSRVVAHDDYDA